MANYNPPPTEFNEPTISGPFYLFEGSFILEFLKPHASRNATVLMRATYKGGHPLCKKGKGHPQAPPLHLHFNQSETFQVLTGRVGTTEEWNIQDKISTPADGKLEIKPWTPHNFWPVADEESDTTILVWAHPDDTTDQMDRLFFTNLLAYVSDVHEGKESISLLQIMLMQHVTSTALIIFPTAWWMGSLRWWIPWKLQGACAWLATCFGMKPLLEKYNKME